MGPEPLTAAQFPENMRSSVRKLIDLLKKSKKVGFNSLKEISISGITIPDSNIIELLQHAASTEASNDLIGLHRFYSLLKNIGVPISLIKNKYGQHLIQNKTTKGPGY